jgi:hypothetical protein
MPPSPDPIPAAAAGDVTTRAEATVTRSLRLQTTRQQTYGRIVRPSRSPRQGEVDPT